jgi:hypothetical protein
VNDDHGDPQDAIEAAAFQEVFLGDPAIGEDIQEIRLDVLSIAPSHPGDFPR